MYKIKIEYHRLEDNEKYINKIDMIIRFKLLILIKKTNLKVNLI